MGVSRKVASLVPSFLRKSAGNGSQARFDTVTNTERGINLRFKHASRCLQAPHIHRGYDLPVQELCSSLWV